ncbi:hypothetical protein H5410_056091 [Solanum commersonii]|uniref:Uncharacterized protein n=1 Tax=Solanum commersonii TaxID=4109 RepID=A0A9J5WKP3_SOLCO|nr:hypothetical protein H5410_056091 [Solanum commersonii]
MALNYIPPLIINGETVVHLEKSEVDLETAKWRYALVAYVMGDFPGYNFMNSRIASAIGKPIYAYECITKQTTISYARMLIETNVTKPLPKEITVHDPNGRQLCRKYGLIGGLKSIKE